MIFLAARHLQIGVLNLMHDKWDTQQRFSKVLKQPGFEVDVTFLYPQTHYDHRPAPELVKQISRPLDLARLQDFDAFIITGAPIEQLAFNEITYIAEVHELIDQLVALNIPQLYICWGAMAAANYLYGIEKHQLSQKLFGVFPNQIINQSQMLAGLPNGFLAPHARYAELDHNQIAQHPDLVIEATTIDDHLFSFRARNQHQYFLFSHLEYGQLALLKEYRREQAAHPEKEYRKPQNYFLDPLHMRAPQMTWQLSQTTFFNNWLNSVFQETQAKHLIKE